jgi:MOSC domain-containing protein YiiM
MQLNVMSSRVIAHIAQDPDRWALAGDQLFVDLDLSQDNLPAGTRLSMGTAVIEVTDQPHTGCPKFTERFGPSALRWVSTEAGKKLRLRGLNARVVQPGIVRPGDAVRKLEG